METINWSQHQELMHAELLGVKPTLLYVVVRGRNAWNSTWVRNYRGPSALIESLTGAKRYAEKSRSQGNVFYIREVPGLALQTEQGPLALVEFHSDNCFAKWDFDSGVDALRLGTPMASVLGALGPEGKWRKPRPSKHSFISGRANWRSLAPLPARRPLVSWTSKAVGANYYLQWRQSSSTYTRQGINRVVREFNRINSEEDRAAAEARYWAAADAALETDLIAEQARHEASLAAMTELEEALSVFLEQDSTEKPT